MHRYIQLTFFPFNYFPSQEDAPWSALRNLMWGHHPRSVKHTHLPQADSPVLGVQHRELEKPPWSSFTIFVSQSLYIGSLCIPIYVLAWTMSDQIKKRPRSFTMRGPRILFKPNKFIILQTVSSSLNISLFVYHFAFRSLISCVDDLKWRLSWKFDFKYYWQRTVVNCSKTLTPTWDHPIFNQRLVLCSKESHILENSSIFWYFHNMCILVLCCNDKPPCSWQYMVPGFGEEITFDSHSYIILQE
jgi:hypothetical protein